jgi:hypothetical protein
MDNIKTLSRTSIIARNVFFVAILVLLFSLIPVSYTAGYSSGLSGAAGIDAGPNNSVETSGPLGIINYYVAIGSGLIGSLALAISAVAGVRKTNLEHQIESMKLKTAEMQYAMQMKEVDILKMELVKDARKKKGTGKK